MASCPACPPLVLTLPIGYVGNWGWLAVLDYAPTAVETSVQMKRVHPLLLVVVFAALIIVGVLWKLFSADECMDRGGTVVVPMKRFPHCAD